MSDERIKRLNKQAEEVQVLRLAVARALEGGWRHPEDWLFVPNFGQPMAQSVQFLDKYGEIWHLPYETLVYRHAFAKALWKNAQMPDDDGGEPPTLGLYKGGGYEGYGDYIEFLGEPWQYHLQQMVVADDPIAYLESTLE